MKNKLFDMFNIILVVAFTLPILKVLSFSPVAAWSWWIVLAPFYGTAIIAGIVMVVQKIMD